MKMHFTKMLSVCCVMLFGVFLVTETNAQGNTCETAAPASSGVNTADGPSDGVSSAVCESTAGAFADWYFWTAPADGSLSISSNGGGVDTQLSIFSGTCDALVCEDSNDDCSGCAAFASAVNDLPVIEGVTYYIQWDNDWSNLGFDWSLTFVQSGLPDCEGVIDGPAQPGTACDDGDDATLDDVYQDDCTCAGEIPAQGEICSNPLPMSPGVNTAPGPSSGFSVDNCDTGAGEFANWYSWTAPADGELNVNSCLGGADTQFSIFSGPCDDLFCEGASDDACPVSEGGSGFASDLTIDVIEGTEYLVQWDNQWSTSGFDFNVTFTPAGTPDCEGVIDGPALPGTPCDDGEVLTIDDVYQDDCSCAGTPVELDCEGVPGGSAVAGTPCDAGEGFVNGVYQDDCSCVGEEDPFFNCESLVEESYCYVNNDDSEFLYANTTGDPISVQFLAGTIESGFDEITIYDGDNDLAPVLFEGDNGGDLTGLLVTSTGGAILIDVDSDGSVSCSSSTTYIEWSWQVCGAEFDFDCEGVLGGSATPGTPCDAGEGFVNGVYQDDCSCVGEEDPFFNCESLLEETYCYVNNDDSEFLYTNTSGDPISVQFLAGTIEENFDEITIYDGDNDLAPVLFEGDNEGDLTGLLVTSTGGAILIDVDSDGSVSCSSSPAYIEWSWQVCGAELVEDCEGVLGGTAGPGTPCDAGEGFINGVYQDDCSCVGEEDPFFNCETLIEESYCYVNDDDTEFLYTNTSGDPISVQFLAGTIEENFDEITIYDGDNDLAPVLFEGDNDGDLTGLVVTSTGGAILIDVDSDASVSCSTSDSYVEWSWQVCGGEAAPDCVDPFPAVDPASISTTFAGNGYDLEWDAVEGQIGCQLQGRQVDGPSLGGRQILDPEVDSFFLWGSVLTPGTDYEWRVRCGCSLDPLVVGPWSDWQPFTTPGGSGIASQPNPTNGPSVVTFNVVENSYATLEVYDMSGRLIDGIFAGNVQSNNEYRFEFDGTFLPNGVYIYRLTTETEVINEKFMIAK
jgi:hypothetical protein